LRLRVNVSASLGRVECSEHCEDCGEWPMRWLRRWTHKRGASPIQIPKRHLPCKSQPKSLRPKQKQKWLRQPSQPWRRCWREPFLSCARNVTHSVQCPETRHCAAALRHLGAIAPVFDDRPYACRTRRIIGRNLNRSRALLKLGDVRDVGNNTSNARACTRSNPDSYNSAPLPTPRACFRGYRSRSINSRRREI
jgi:hypothetical protein